MLVEAVQRNARYQATLSNVAFSWAESRRRWIRKGNPEPADLVRCVAALRC